MQYILTGFTHNMGFREFAFECVGEDRVRTDFLVKADLSLIRRYGIRVQELPLLCRGILERRSEADPQRTFTYTEADMSLYAEVCAARGAAQKKRASRTSHGENVTAASGGAGVVQH